MSSDSTQATKEDAQEPTTVADKVTEIAMEAQFLGCLYAYGSGASTRALAYKDVLFLVQEIHRLEKMALDDDNYRCESCERVFPDDEIVFGEDCNLCITCIKEIAEANV